MTLTLKHAIKIEATRDLVFKALTDIDKMSAWHCGTVEGEIAVGSQMCLNAKPGLKFSYETKELVSNERIVQTCTEGPGNSVGKELRFALSDAEAGVTLVQLSDGDWAEGDDHLPFCNTHWGGVLYRLKKYVEEELS